MYIYLYIITISTYYIMHMLLGGFKRPAPRKSKEPIGTASTVEPKLQLVAIRHGEPRHRV